MTTLNLNIVYTHRGFPALMDVAISAEAVYEAPEVSEIYRRRCEQTRPGFKEELDQIAILLREWTATNGFFLPALQPSVRLGGTVQAVIAETALYLTKRITRRRMMLQDRARMMKHDTAVAVRLPTFTPEERAAVEELANMTPEAVIQLWITRCGVDDLSSTLQLYVGDRTVAAVM